MTSTKNTYFLQAHKKIIAEVEKETKDIKKTIKNGYVRLSVYKHNILEVILYATNNEVSLTTSWGCIKWGGLRDRITENNFLNKEETEVWGTKEWNKYIKTVTKYICAMVKFKNKLNFAWESYGNYGIDYAKLTTKLLSLFGEDWWISASDAISEDCINAFAAFPPKYEKIGCYLKSLKSLNDIMDKAHSLLGEEEDIEEKCNGNFVAEWNKRLLKRCTPKQKELLNGCLYETTEEGNAT